MPAAYTHPSLRLPYLLYENDLELDYINISKYVKFEGIMQVFNLQKAKFYQNLLSELKT